MKPKQRCVVCGEPAFIKNIDETFNLKKGTFVANNCVVSSCPSCGMEFYDKYSLYKIDCLFKVALRMEN